MNPAQPYQNPLTQLTCRDKSFLPNEQPSDQDTRIQEISNPQLLVMRDLAEKNCDPSSGSNQNPPHQETPDPQSTPVSLASEEGGLQTFQTIESQESAKLYNQLTEDITTFLFSLYKRFLPIREIASKLEKSEQECREFLTYSRNWTVVQTERLNHFHSLGLSLKEISYEIPGRTVEACHLRYLRHIISNRSYHTRVQRTQPPRRKLISLSPAVEPAPKRSCLCDRDDAFFGFAPPSQAYPSQNENLLEKE